MKRILAITTILLSTFTAANAQYRPYSRGNPYGMDMQRNMENQQDQLQRQMDNAQRQMELTPNLLPPPQNIDPYGGARQNLQRRLFLCQMYDYCE